MNPIMISVLMISIIILINYFLSNNREGFSDYNPNLIGYEEGHPDEYRLLDYPKHKIGLQNMKEHIGNNWHLRFPYMVNQRYAYDDLRNDCPCTSIFDFATLKQLPQEVRNRYYATVPWELSKKDLKYYPDMTNKKHKCHGYPQKRYPYYNSIGIPFLTDTKYDILMNRKPIYGYDYENMYDTTMNAGDGTSDQYYYIDRIINKNE